jgi:hypothetical protein
MRQKIRKKESKGTQAYLERYRQLSALDQQKNDFIEVRTQFLPWSVIDLTIEPGFTFMVEFLLLEGIL